MSELAVEQEIKRLRNKDRGALIVENLLECPTIVGLSGVTQLNDAQRLIVDWLRMMSRREYDGFPTNAAIAATLLLSPGETAQDRREVVGQWLGVDERTIRRRSDEGITALAKDYVSRAERSGHFGSDHHVIRAERLPHGGVEIYVDSFAIGQHAQPEQPDAYLLTLADWQNRVQLPVVDLESGEADASFSKVVLDVLPEVRSYLGDDVYRVELHFKYGQIPLFSFIDLATSDDLMLTFGAHRHSANIALSRPPESWRSAGIPSRA